MTWYMGHRAVKIKEYFRTQVFAASRTGSPPAGVERDNAGSGRQFAGEAAPARIAVVPFAKARWFSRLAIPQELLLQAMTESPESPQCIDFYILIGVQAV